ncbi:MAG: DUF1932 domain-containing protein [Pseudomonadota bacterium]
MHNRSKNTSALSNAKIALLGFGEAAQAFVNGWHADGLRGFHAYDIKTRNSSPERDAKLADYERLDVAGAEDVRAAVGDADIVFSFVTADQAFAAARDAAPHLKSGALFLDCNSCSPNTKKQSCETITGSGVNYVDAAVMAPVYPRLQKTPILLSGQVAVEACESLGQAGMNAKAVGDEVGRASAIKLSRSIMIKGMEALMAECMLTARSLGVEDAVLSSLEASDPGFAWRERAGYALERMSVHGVRRAAEMREAASMVEDLALPARMSHSIVEWQQQIADLETDAVEGGFEDRADRLLAKLGSDGS